MPAVNTKGTVVSFGNTPQAVDDLLSITDHSNFVNGAIILDVMGNDLGGNAKSLYSLADIADSTRPAALLTQDAVGAENLSKLGATIKITSDGKVSYVPTSSINGLPVDVPTQDSFIYAIKLGNGTLSWAKATITIINTNDGPVVQGPLHVEADEGASAFATDLLAGASDADTLDTLSVTNVSYKVDGIAAASVDGISRSGNTLTVNPADSAFNHLAVNQKVVIQVFYDVTDPHGATVAQTETITINGTNDGPEVSGPLTAVADEGSGNLTVNLLEGATDPDDGETDTLSVSGLTVAVDGVSLPGLPAYLSLSGGDLKVDTSDAAFDHLTRTATAEIKVSYFVEDAQHAKVAQTETITIQGTNDSATFEGQDTGSINEDDAPSVTGTLTVKDVDDGESFMSASKTDGAYGTLEIDDHGVWTYTIDQAKADDLNNGDVEPDVFTVTSVDGTEHQISIDVHGHTDARDFSFSYQAQTETVTGATVLFQQVSGEAQNDTIKRYIKFLTSLGHDSNGDGTIDVSPDQNGNSQPTVEGFTGTFGPGFTTTGTGHGQGGDGRYYVGSATPSTTITEFHNTDGISPAAIINNFHAGTDTLNFAGVTQQNFVDHFAVTNADVTGDGVADTTITADGDDSFSIILTGVVISKAALSTEINFV